MELPTLPAIPALPSLAPLSRLPPLPALSSIAAPSLPSRPVTATPASLPVSSLSSPVAAAAAASSTAPPPPDLVVVAASKPDSAAPSTAPTTPVATALSPPRKSATSPSRTAHGSTDAVLPRGSLVKIVGNNRTKGDLVGREGIVQGAQTLGGWHEVQLYDNSTVRVQRNALMLLKVADATLLSLLQPAPPRPSSHVLSASLASRGAKRRRRLAVAGDDHSTRVPRVCANIGKLHSKSLRKYRSHYNLPVANDCSREELVVAVRKHFARNTVDEAKVIAGFIRFMKTPRTRRGNTGERGEGSQQGGRGE